jgi:hypothetical protein
MGLKIMAPSVYDLPAEFHENQHVGSRVTRVDAQTDW